MKNNIVAYINGNEYEAVSGVVYAEEFNETLDSLSIVIDNVPKGKRISLNPYDFVRVMNKSEDSDKYPFDVEMIVDNYVESEESISQHIYKYSINLMSETKLLEKIQCPNLAITHSLVAGKKSIFEYIKQFHELYAPKIKIGNNATAKTWTYAPLFSLSSELEGKFGNVPCADMAMQQPTLRQLLTNLMLQSSCIPVIKNRTLTYLDLSEKPTEFNVSASGLNKIQRSNSSDSYVNTLTSMKDQLLDTGNKVISETLGFRDKDNVLIKQTENLKLETAFPIYNVTKCIMRMPCGISAKFHVDNINCGRNMIDKTLPILNLERVDNKIRFMYYVADGASVPSVKKAFITFYKQNPSVALAVKETVDVTSEIVFNQWAEVAIPGDLTQNDYFYFYSETSDGRIIATRLCQLDTKDVDNIIDPKDYNLGIKDVYGYFKTDITPNVVENTKRKLLNVDFTTMPNSDGATASDVAKWIYGTVGYSIGSKTISGFSQTYSKSVGWWDEKYTYFENIVNVLAPASEWYGVSRFDSAVEIVYRNWLGGYKGYLGFYITPYTNTFASTIFDIEYQPLNSVTLKTFKEDTPIELEQLDGTSQGVTDFDRFADNLQEKTDRLGNDVMSINQTTDDGSDVQKVNTHYDDYVCFKRTIAISNNYVQANYSLSKDYVMKNYFTSITTKYRAYEHVDYSQSTLRKESRHTFVTLDKGNHLGESIILNIKGEQPSIFFKGLTEYSDATPIRYAYEQANNESGALETAKYDVSAITCENSLLFSFESPDNVGAGSYLNSPKVDESLGGVTQSYQIWGNDYKKSRFLGFIDKLPYYDSTSDSVFFEACKTPIFENNSYVLINDRIRIEDTSGKARFYQDPSERLNFTAQFVYMNKAKDVIEFSEELIKNCPYIDNSVYGRANGIVIVTNESDNKLYDYPNQKGVLIPNLKISDLVHVSSNNNEIIVKSLGCVKSEYENYTYKIVHSYRDDSDGSYKHVDIALVKIKGAQSITLYAYLNDTNTQKIYGVDDNGVFRPMYKDDGSGNRTYTLLQMEGMEL